MGKKMKRRRLVQSLLAAGVVAPFVRAESAPDRGGPVLDTHLHLRRDADPCFTHNNTGYPQFDKVLRAYPRTMFIGHGDLFWAHISADVPTDRGYPAGPIKPGGLTDKWLSDFPNLYADMSANSGNNALSRDTDFTRDFLVRHQRKLLFGSDCSCTDGKGSGVSQNNNPEAARLAGKCVARETLGLLQQLASPEIFRRVVWENGTELFRLRFS